MSDASADAPLSLRDRNKQRAREEIAEVALRLFAERGYDAVTVDDVVAEAGVSRRTFFRYFETKEDALLADYPKLARLLDDAVARVDERSTVAALRAVVHALADYYRDRRQEVLTRSQILRDSDAAAARNLRLLSEWEASLATMIAARVEGATDELTVRAAAVVTIAAFRVALGQWVRDGGRGDLHGLVDSMVDLVAHGIARPLGESRRR